MSSIEHDIFGSQVNATVTIVVGAAESIEIDHTNGILRRSVCRLPTLPICDAL